VPLDLHEWGVDFAAWCHYKYLNAGAGATAGAFVHQKHHHNPNIPRFEGWWGTDKSSRFQMLPNFSPIPTAEAWQLSNAPVFSMSPLRASLEIFEQTDMLTLRKESIRLTNYLERSLKECLDPELFEIITPQNPAERGAQLSVFIHKNGKQTHQKLTQAGVIADWREPNVLRLAPAPLYNNLKDIDMLCGILTASV
jgi:kynureninase